MSKQAPFQLWKQDVADGQPAWIGWRARSDNLGWLWQTGDKRAVAVDSPDAGRLLEVLSKEGLTLEALLLTHGHYDHVDRVSEIVDQTGCRLWGPSSAVPVGLGQTLKGGDVLKAGGVEVRVLDTSGHSEEELSFWVPEKKWCFCADTLFDGGCGRMFAGPPDTFWASLKTLRSLPKDALLFQGHDYAEDNAAFASHLLPEDPIISAWRSRLHTDPATPPGPLRLSDQMRHNLFLRADDPDLARALGLEGLADWEVFAWLRERKNQF